MITFYVILWAVCYVLAYGIGLYRFCSITPEKIREHKVFMSVWSLGGPISLISALLHSYFNKYKIGLRYR